MHYLLLLLLVLSMETTQALEGEDYTKLAELQRAEGNFTERFNYTMYADILNASEEMAPKISVGAYESTKYLIPVGPYTISFELRSPLDYFGVEYFTHNESLGWGKNYHTAQYDVYLLTTGNITYTTVIDETIAPNGTRIKNSPDRLVPDKAFRLYIYIIHYIGPQNFPAETPIELLFDDIFEPPRNWESGTSYNITIGGKDGAAWEDIKWSKDFDILAERYNYMYNLDPNTKIAITASGDWDVPKDLSLFEETLNIAS